VCTSVYALARVCVCVWRARARAPGSVAETRLVCVSIFSTRHPFCEWTLSHAVPSRTYVRVDGRSETRAWCVRVFALPLRSGGGHFESMSARRGGDYQHRRIVTPKLDGSRAVSPFLDDIAPIHDSPRRSRSFAGSSCSRDDAPSLSLSSSPSPSPSSSPLYLEMVLSNRPFYFREETPTRAAATPNGPRPFSENLYF